MKKLYALLKNPFNISRVEADGEFLKLEFSGDSNLVGDEYHTIDELYDHRRALNIALFHALKKDYKVVKSKLHNDGSMFTGYFIVMAVTEFGQISYHYDLKYWDSFNLTEVDRTPPYDGHSSSDVIYRLEQL